MSKHKNSGPFSVHDLINLSSLVGKLTPQDPLSKFLWTQFSEPAKKTLEDRNSTKKKQEAAVIEGLNKVVNGASIHEEDRFAGVRLSRKTLGLKAQDPQGAELVRLNRLFLEDAYPLELRRDQNLREKLKEQWPFVLWVGIFFLVIFFGLVGPCIVAYLRWKWDWMHFWHYWEVGALISTAFYNGLFYLLGFFRSPRMFKHVEFNYVGLIPILCGIAVFLLIGATAVSFMEKWGWMQLLLIFLGTVCFWKVDHIMAQHSKIEAVRQDFDASVRLNDMPALVAFGVLFLFSLIYPMYMQMTSQGGGYDSVFRAFMGGAIGFQMIASNWALALIFRKPGEPTGATD